MLLSWIPEPSGRLPSLPLRTLPLLRPPPPPPLPPPLPQRLSLRSLLPPSLLLSPSRFLVAAVTAAVATAFRGDGCLCRGFIKTQLHLTTSRISNYNNQVIIENTVIGNYYLYITVVFRFNLVRLRGLSLGRSKKLVNLSVERTIL